MGIERQGMNNSYVAIDLGATSGRVVSSAFDGKRVILKEENRFLNEPVTVHNTVYWDVLNMYQNILIGIHKASKNGSIASLGIDTWGSDFGLFDKKGHMLENPIHYRDDMSKGMPEAVYEMLPAEQLYNLTGIQHMRLNGIYRLFYMAQNAYVPYTSAKNLLLMPDIFAYFLTGEMLSEYTEATTTQMVDAGTNNWAYEALGQLGINTTLLRKPVLPGSIQVDTLKSELPFNCKLSIVGTHDTASAVAAVPASEADFIYISSGTWSLVGTEIKQPMINEMSRANNFTNEGGVFGTIRLLKNVMGMWILEELRRFWASTGNVLSYDEIIAKTEKAQPFARLINPDEPEFFESEKMEEKINAFLHKTKQPMAVCPGEFSRCLFDSLALKYRYVIDTIKTMTAKTYRSVHVVGGGAKNKMLNQMVANVTGMTVLAGPEEATALGNILMQAAACGDISGLGQLREVVRNSCDIKVFLPEQIGIEEEAYQRFCAMITD